MNGNRSKPAFPAFLERYAAGAVDFAMCLMMNGVQWRHRLAPEDRAAFERYVIDCERLTREDYFAAPGIDGAEEKLAASLPYWHWPSPIQTVPPLQPAAGTLSPNDFAHVDLYPCEQGWSAPTVLFLHALMSTSDAGYRRWARQFHARGWNACFVHLPYHYSRTPPGFSNGELAITADLVRTGEGLRQSVCELRQLMARLRELGSPGFGLWATSYGGWIGALLSFMEADFRWIALMAPVVNIEHAIWQSLASIGVRRQLRRVGIDHALVARHAHLTSPLHGTPLCGGEPVLLAAGLFDRVAPRADIAALAARWGSELLEVPQGHFGYKMMPAVFHRLIQRNLI